MEDEDSRLDRWVSIETLKMIEVLVDSFNQKASTLGMQQLVWPERVPTRSVRLIYKGESIEKAQQNGEVAILGLLAELPKGWSEHPNLVEQYRVDFDMPTLFQNKWRYVGKIRTQGQENLITTVLKQDDVPKRYLTSGSSCEHCNTNRRRNSTYLFREMTGKFKQVGRTCLQDFLDTPKAIELVDLEEMAHDLRDKVASLPEYILSAEAIKHRTLLLEPYLACVGHSIETSGWVSRSDAKGYELPTSSDALAIFMMVCKQKLVVAEKHYETARKAISWALGLSEEEKSNSDFLKIVTAVAAKETLLDSHLGVAAALVRTYQNHIASVARAEVEKKSAFVGEVGTKAVIDEVLCEKVTSHATRYGTTRLHRMRDRIGNLLIWFSSSHQLDEGKSYRLSATIKEHVVHNGVCQTVLTRAKPV